MWMAGASCYTQVQGMWQASDRLPYHQRTSPESGVVRVLVRSSTNRYVHAGCRLLLGCSQPQCNVALDVTLAAVMAAVAMLHPYSRGKQRSACCHKQPSSSQSRWVEDVCCLTCSNEHLVCVHRVNRYPLISFTSTPCDASYDKATACHAMMALEQRAC